MAEITRDRHGRWIGHPIKERDFRCLFCGEKADAFWSLEIAFGVCVYCATDVLPRVIADAVLAHESEEAPYNALSRFSKALELAYWQAGCEGLARRPSRNPTRSATFQEGDDDE